MQHENSKRRFGSVPFPDLELMSDSGVVRRLSEFKGKIILVEPVGMNCPACNRADSTGHRPRDDLFRELLPIIPTLL